ncbi:ORF5 [Atractylodes mild mottle virus]|uniref:Enzymatic polyprotein n=1 Tax=Atractylodes mild mottle virus TaxID=1711685 RepID=A0A0M4J1F9_9VIRU|nr:ORF5 [Atractylodes mild mottle virus]ALD49090.1 ORF5 [Atractylodes mild mottle virus]
MDLLQKVQIQNNHQQLSLNATNTSSIYISGKLKFQGYKQLDLHCFVDTGASMCVASKHVIPEEHWENSSRQLLVKTANGMITINKVCKNIDIMIADTIFHIPTIYQQEIGIDLLLGNNFLLLYGPFTQYTDRIILFKENQPVIIGKVSKAYLHGMPGYLDSMKKNSRNPVPPPINITSNKIEDSKRFSVLKLQLLERGREIINRRLFLTQQDQLSTIEKLLDEVCSENPIDPHKSKKWMTASIKLKDPNTLVQVKPMQYCPEDRKEFAVQIKELLDLKIIIPSKSPHRSPAFLVENEAERRRGKKRMVVNYKKLNEVTLGDSHNLPNKDELLTLIRGKTIYSSFDCKSGFWQVLLDQESQLLTAFTCPTGHYQWKVVPFGLKQAPSIFQRHMNNAFREFEEFCCVYVDDILVFSKNETEHRKHVIAILEQCKNLGIILSKKKAHLFKTKINFLGLEIDQGSHKPQNHILEHIHKFPDRLEDKKQLQRFLGILTYASDYIPKLAQIRKPFQAKLKKDVTWSWTDSDTSLMIKIKKGLKSFPTLYHPKEEDNLIIECDASDSFWGGILKAKTIDEDKEYICRYTSGSFKQAELNYHSNEKEILAAMNTIKKFSGYLTPVKFLIRTDNKNFTFFLNTNHKGDYKQGRLIRWQMWFSRYSFTVEHLPGNKNVFADFLTREFNN